MISFVVARMFSVLLDLTVVAGRSAALILALAVARMGPNELEELFE